MASMVALRLCVGDGPQHFTGVSGLWTGGLLQEGMVFKHLPSQKVYLSLGFVHAAVMLWMIEEISESRKGLAIRISFPKALQRSIFLHMLFPLHFLWGFSHYAPVLDRVAFTFDLRMPATLRMIFSWLQTSMTPQRLLGTDCGSRRVCTLVVT